MTRFLTWLTRLVPPRGPLLGGLLPGVFLDGQVFLVWLVKKLPPRVGGYLTWVWVWGFTYPDHRGTLLGVRSWYRTLSWAVPHREILRVVPVVRVPRIGPPRPVGLPGEDTEWYTLDNVYPPGVEPFQDSILDRFEVQQDYDPEQGEDFTPPEDLLLGVPEGVSREEPDGLLFRGRFSRLKKRISPREGDPLEFFYRSPQRSLSRVVDPGDGPAVDDQDDLEEVMSPGGEPLWDWYLTRGAPPEITQGDYPGGYYQYLHLQHRRSWRGDPTGDPTGWATRVDGLIPWLFRTKSRRLTSRVDRYRRWRRRNFFRWIRKPSRRVGPHGPRRRLRFRKLRLWNKAVNFVNRYQRWTPPAPQEVHFDTQKTKYDRFENSRFTRWGLSHRGRRLRWRATRVALSAGWFRRRYPRVTHGGPHRGRWLSEVVIRGPHRGRYLPWGRPGWLSRGTPRVTPPGYLLVGVALAGILLAGLIPLLEVWPAGGVRGPGWGILPPRGPREPIHWAAPVEGAPLGGEYLGRPPTGAPGWWETFRDWTPRGVRSTDPGFYLGWSNEWFTRLMFLPTVGFDWTDTPGIGGNLFVRDFFRRIFPYWAGWESYSILPDHTWGVLTGVVAQDPRGETYYQEYWGPRLPSYAHFDYKINDAGVGINYMEMWRDRVPWYLPPGESKWTLPPVPDDLSERRFLDFYYGDYGGMTVHWRTIVEYDHPELPDWVGWVYTEAVPYSLSPGYYERAVHAEVRLPEWGARDPVWEDLTRDVAWADSGVVWFGGPYHLGMNDHFVWSNMYFPRTEGFPHLLGGTPWGIPGGANWLDFSAPTVVDEVIKSPVPSGWVSPFRGVAYAGGLLILGGRTWTPSGGFTRVVPTRRRTPRWVALASGAPRVGARAPTRGAPEANFLTLWTPRGVRGGFPRGETPTPRAPTRGARFFVPPRGVQTTPGEKFTSLVNSPGGVVFFTRRGAPPGGAPRSPPGVFGGRFRTQWELTRLLPEEIPRWRSRGVPRGWGFPRVGPPVRAPGITWRVPSANFTRMTHGTLRGGHLQSTLGGYTLGSSSAPPGGPVIRWGGTETTMMTPLRLTKGMTSLELSLILRAPSKSTRSFVTWRPPGWENSRKG